MPRDLACARRISLVELSVGTGGAGAIAGGGLAFCLAPNKLAVTLGDVLATAGISFPRSLQGGPGAETGTAAGGLASAVATGLVKDEGIAVGGADAVLATGGISFPRSLQGGPGAETGTAAGGLASAVATGLVKDEGIAVGGADAAMATAGPIELVDELFECHNSFKVGTSRVELDGTSPINPDEDGSAVMAEDPSSSISSSMPAARKAAMYLRFDRRAFHGASSPSMSLELQWKAITKIY